MNTQLVLLLLLVTAGSVLGQDRKPEVGPFISWLLEDGDELKAIPFPDVIKATSGKTIIPINLTNKVDAELLAKIGAALNQVVQNMNAPGSPAAREHRINEVSAHFEVALKAALNSIPGFACDYPKTAAGQVQRSGYPDLRLADRQSGHIVYFDPKLYERGSRRSTFRSFYFEPKRRTNKVLDDAHHLLAGIEHDGGQTGAWKFLHWELVDLSRFEVRLKAEFQGSNRDLYQPKSVVGASRKE